jgi:hypothetical protein
LHDSRDLRHLLISYAKVSGKQVEDRVVVVEICDCETRGECKKNIYCCLVRKLETMRFNREAVKSVKLSVQNNHRTMWCFVEDEKEDTKVLLLLLLFFATLHDSLDRYDFFS